MSNRVKVFCEVDVLSFIIISSDIGYYGSGVFNMRGNGQGTGGFTVVFRNIVVEDTRPTMASFKIQMEYWKDPENHSRRGPGDLYGMVFQNISIAAHSILDPEEEPEVLWGKEDGHIFDLVFDNVWIGNELVDSVYYFFHNKYVFDRLILPQSNK